MSCFDSASKKSRVRVPGAESRGPPDEIIATSDEGSAAGVRTRAGQNTAAGSTCATATSYFVLTTKRIGPPGRGIPFKLFADTRIATLSNPIGMARTRLDAFPDASVVSTEKFPLGRMNRFWSSTSTTDVSATGLPSG